MQLVLSHVNLSRWPLHLHQSCAQREGNGSERSLRGREVSLQLLHDGLKGSELVPLPAQLRLASLGRLEQQAVVALPGG